MIFPGDGVCPSILLAIMYKFLHLQQYSAILGVRQICCSAPTLPTIPSKQGQMPNYGPFYAPFLDLKV